MENLSEDEAKQVEMLDKLDFFKRDHNLPFGGALKPDAYKQWQILCRHIVPALKYLSSFSPPGFLITSNILWMADGAAGGEVPAASLCVCTNVTASPTGLSCAVVVFFFL